MTMMHFTQLLSPARSLTEQMLDKTQSWNTSGKLVSRWVVSRGMGSLGVAAASSIDAIREVVLAILTACCIVSNRANIKASWIHLGKAARHVAGAVAALGLGAIAPSELLIPCMAKMGFDVRARGNNLLNRRIAIATMAGAGIVGLTLAAQSFNLLSAFNLFKPAPAPGFSFPSKTQIALFVGLSHLVAYKVVGRAHYAPISGHPGLSFYEKSAELPIISTGTSIARLVGNSLIFVVHSLFFLNGSHRRHARQQLKETVVTMGRTGVQAVPCLGNLAAVCYSHNPRRTVGDNSRLQSWIRKAEAPRDPFTIGDQYWLAALKAVRAERSVKFKDWMKTLTASGLPNVDRNDIGLLADNKGGLWRVTASWNAFIDLCPHPEAACGQYQIVMNEAQEVLTGDQHGVVSLSSAEGQQLRTHLSTYSGRLYFSENFFKKMDRALGGD